MLMEIFAVFDSKVGTYGQPLFLRSKGEAVRSFQEAVSSNDHIFCKHPEDFTLFHLGCWDDTNALFDMLPTPCPIGKAIEFLPQSPRIAKVN